MNTETPAKNSRQVSFVDKIKVTFSCPTKNIYKNAIALGDVDNDPNQVLFFVIPFSLSPLRFFCVFDMIENTYENIFRILNL
jgi:hypothetical protein